jgi:peptidoglycan/LPS O-acetylase OafA/YrhL
MIGNYDWVQYNTAFWSLGVEMRVSIIFPILFMVVHRLRTRTALLLAFLISTAASLGMAHWPHIEASLNTLAYAAIFICGIIFARNIERVNDWYYGLRKLGATMIACSSFVLYTWGHHIAIIFGALPIGLDQWLITAGAAGYMILALNAPPIRQFLNMEVAKFLGRISYSLYLVHGTVLFALTYLLGSRLPVLAQFAIYLPASLLIAYVFCLTVEEPFLHVSRFVGKVAQTHTPLLQGSQ